MNSKLAVALLSTAFVTIGHLANAETFSSSPAVSSLGPGELSVFAIKASNSRLTKKRWMLNHWSTWSEVSTLSVAPTSQPAAVSYTLFGTRYDAVCVRKSGSTLGCFTGTNLGTYTEPVSEDSPGGGASGGYALATTATADNMQVLLFYVDPLGMLQFRTYYPNVNVWGAARAVVGAPQGLTGIAAASKDGSPWLLQICGRVGLSSQYSCVLRNDINSTSVAWSSVPGVYDSTPAVTINQAGPFRIGHVFGNSNFDTQIWHTAILFGWSNPAPRGGNIAFDPAAVSWGGETLHLFARAAFDNNIWFTYYDAGAWAPTWFPL